METVGTKGCALDFPMAGQVGGHDRVLAPPDTWWSTELPTTLV